MRTLTETTPDFGALRAERNKEVMEAHQRLADELGVPLKTLRSNHDPNACYCACTSGGPCEHKWDGEPWESADGCGCTSMSHDMRVLP